MLAMSHTAIKGISLAVFTSAVAIIAVIINRALHSKIKPSLHFIWSLFLVGSITTILELLFQLSFMPLYRELGIYVPLASCNLALLIHLQQQYQRGSTISYPKLLRHSLAMTAGLIIAMGLFASLREIVVFGTLFRDIQLLTSLTGIPIDAALNTRDNQLFSFGLLQPGAFILLALLIAAKRGLEQHFSLFTAEQSQPIEKVARARVTGKI